MAILVAAAAAFWVVLGLPARGLAGDEQLVFAGVAVTLSLVPGILTMLWAGWAHSQNPQMEALAVLGGTGIRMFGVLLVALAMFQGTELFRKPSFLLWVAGAYVFLLAVEVVLLVRSQQAAQRKTGTGA